MNLRFTIRIKDKDRRNDETFFKKITGKVKVSHYSRKSNIQLNRRLDQTKNDLS